MASFFNNLGRFGRPVNKAPSPQPSGKQSPSPGLSGTSQSPFQPPPTSQQSSYATTAPTAMPEHSHNENRPLTAQRKPPFFFREENSNLIVKGNFMTLAAKPESVELGEWLAHQVVEQYRLLESNIKVIQEVDTKTNLPICNPHTCPTMSAAEFTYTWLDNNKTPIRIPASQYITLVQKWIMGKINDQRLFPVDQTTTYSNTQPSTPGAGTPIAVGPTNLNVSLSTLSGRDWVGKSSGFPESFENDIKSLYRQMFRCYAHIYHGHWVDPFYHLSAAKELNTCFIHFVNVGRLFDLLHEKDLKPMQPLVDIWLAKGLLPLPTAEQPEIVSAPA